MRLISLCIPILTSFSILLSTSSHAGLDDFYGLIGFKFYDIDSKATENSLTNLLDSSSRTLDYISPDNKELSFSLGYKFRPIKIFTSFNLSKIDATTTNALYWRPTTITDELNFSNIKFGVGYQYDLSNNFYVDIEADYSLNKSDFFFTEFDYTYNPDNTFGISIGIGFSTKLGWGPIGAKASQTFGHDPYGFGSAGESSNIEIEYPGIVGTFVFFIAGLSQTDAGGFSTYEWDQFNNQYGQSVWRCRDTSTGRFASDYKCAGKVKSDRKWPGK